MHTEIVIAHAVANRLERLIEDESPRESFAILAGGISSSKEHCRLLAKAIFVPSKEDYEEQTRTSVRVTKEWFQGVLKNCAEKQWHVVLLHSHPFSRGVPGESTLDLAGAASMCPAIAEAFPGMAIATMVTGKALRHVEAHFFNVFTGKRDPVDLVLFPRPGRLEVALPRSTRLPACDTQLDDAFWSRFQLAFGPELIRIAQHLQVGVIGAGSLGEPVLLQLANLGFPITVADTDTLGEENVNRSWYGNTRDAAKGTAKVDLMHRAVRKTNPRCRFHAIRGDIRDREIQHQLAECHILVVTTDNVTSRFVASQLAMVHGQVLFDAGTAIDVGNDRLTSVRGQVVRLVPGLNLCHACADFFKSADAVQGLLSDEDYAIARRRQYVNGADIQAPSVMPVNTVLAGMCVWELLRYLSGATPDHSPDIVTVDLLQNTTESHFYPRNEDGQRVACTSCSPEGDLFTGDRGPLLTRDTLQSSERLLRAIQKLESRDDGTTNTTE